MLSEKDLKKRTMSAKEHTARPGIPCLLEKAKGTLWHHSMLGRGETVVLAVSGGMDSMTLLDVFSQLQKPWKLKIVVAHVNHGLRGEESEREFRFVEEQATRYGVPFQGKVLSDADYPGRGNLQDHARRLRYRFFEEVATRWQGKRIATGHTRDDHVETLLMQAFRGAGGLKGIPPVREERYIRPLLDVSRQEIGTYVAQRGIPYCEDSSNRRKSYLRNRIRQDFVPWIRREVNPNFDEAFLQLAFFLQEESQYLDGLARQALSDVIEAEEESGDLLLDRRALGALHPVLQRRLLRLAFARFQGSTAGLSYAHLEPVCLALFGKAEKGEKRFCLPARVALVVEEDRIRLSRRGICREEAYSYPFAVGQTRAVPEAGLEIRSERVDIRVFLERPLASPGEAFLDADRCSGEMRVRSFRPGDRFVPLGLGGEKKLKDFFINQKVPRTWRRRVPLLEVAGRIAWVVGYRIDDRFKVGPFTRGCVHLEATQPLVERSPET